MKKEQKAIEVYNGQECAEIRHTAARSLDTEKVGHGFFFFKQKTAYEIASCLVGSEMCIRDRCLPTLGALSS